MPELKKYRGVIIPIVTPFTEDGDLDEPAARRITDHVVEAGCTPFVLGTTGEYASVPAALGAHHVEVVIDQVAGRTMTFAGISSTCLAHSIELANQYFGSGMDAAIAHLPQCYQLTPDGMLKYYEELADSVPGPLILYNNPLTTHMSIPIDVMDQLSHHPNIVGVKDSERNADRFEMSIPIWRDREDFSHFTGWSMFAARGLSLGSAGIVPSGGNIIPKMYRELYDAAVNGDKARAEQLQAETDEICELYLSGRMLGEALAALKVILSEMGLCGDTVLPPLFTPSDEEKAKIKSQVSKLGLAKIRSR